MSIAGHKNTKEMSKLKKLIFKKENRYHKNNLNKMKILVANSITFKIPILTAVVYDISCSQNSDIKCNRLHYQYLHLV